MTQRVVLTDGSKTWFDTDSSVLFNEHTYWDGRNHISVPTGSQWNHESLYHTKSGKWVLNEWSNYQGSRETYSQITEATAIEWMVQNNCIEDRRMADLPEEVRLSVQAGSATAEI